MKGSMYPFKKLEQQTSVNRSENIFAKVCRNLEGWPPDQGADATLYLSLPLAVSREGSQRCH